MLTKLSKEYSIEKIFFTTVLYSHLDRDEPLLGFSRLSRKCPRGLCLNTDQSCCHPHRPLRVKSVNLLISYIYK